MEEQYLDFDFDTLDTLEEQTTEYEKKVKAIQMAYSDLEKYKAEQREKYYFINNLLHWQDGIYYVLSKEESYKEIKIGDPDIPEECYTEYEHYNSYIVYDGKFICRINIGKNEEWIQRSHRCILPQVDKQLEYYGIKLQFESIEKRYKDTGPTAEQIKKYNEETKRLIKD